MSLEEFYYVSQIIASIGVLASVIYLALQTRQTARNQKTALHQNRATLACEDIRQLADPAKLSVLMAGEAGEDAISDVQFWQYAGLLISRLVVIEEQYRQYREGNFDASRWTSTARGLPFVFRTPGARAMVRFFQTTADKDFSALLDKVMIEARAMPKVDPKAIWLALAADERAALSAETIIAH